MRFLAALGVGTGWYVVVPTLAAAAVFSAALSDNANVFASGNLIVSASSPGPVVCASSGSTISSDAAACSANPLPVGPLTTTAASATTTLSSTGSLSATSALVTSSGCGVQQFADTSVAASNPALPLAGVTFGASMVPLASTSATFDGVAGYAETVKSFANPSTFSLVGWFNTTSKQGTLLGFSSVQTNASSTSNDRELWIDSAGNLVWATATSATVTAEAVSTKNYADGAWHFVVATIGATNKMQLFVDGQPDGSATASSAYNYTGYWHLGWGSELAASPNFSNKPTNAYFKGALAGLAVIPSQLSAAQVTSLYAATTQANYNAAIGALAPTSYWPMTDTGNTPYTGALPTLAATTVKFLDASGHSHVASPGTGTVTTAAAGPLGGAAVTLSGAAGSAINATVAATTVQVESQSVWFKTTASGVVMSENTLATDGGAPASSDHLLWIDSTGHLVYGVAYGATPTRLEVTSPLKYNDGTWHLALTTVSATGASLYVDGAPVASYSSALSVQSYSGYWHLGYGYVSGWTDPPTSSYFAGSLAHVAVYPATLSAAQVATLALPTTSAAQTNAILTLSPSDYWPLNDVVTSPACALAEVTLGATKGAAVTCVEPLSASACTVPTTAVEANTLLPKTMPVPVSATPVSIVVSLKVAATPAVGLAGLHLLMPLTFMTQISTFTAEVSYAMSETQL